MAGVRFLGSYPSNDCLRKTTLMGTELQMSSDDFLKALAGLESRLIDRIQALNRDTTSEMVRIDKSTTAQINVLTVEFAKLQAEVRLRSCPSPGLCEPLKKTVDDLAQRVRPIEDVIQQGVGMRKTILLLATIGPLLSGFLGVVAGRYTASDAPQKAPTHEKTDTR